MDEYEHERELICIILDIIYNNAKDDGEKELVTHYKESIIAFTVIKEESDIFFVDEVMNHHVELARLIVKYSYFIDTHNFSMCAYFMCQTILASANDYLGC